MKRLVQIHNEAIRRVALVEEPRLRLLSGVASIYELAIEALEGGGSFHALIEEKASAELLDYVHNAGDFRMEGGYIAPLPLPGLGVEINEERVIEASRAAPDWRNPLWRHAEGSVAEW